MDADDLRGVDSCLSNEHHSDIAWHRLGDLLLDSLSLRLQPAPKKRLRIQPQRRNHHSTLVMPLHRKGFLKAQNHPAEQ